MSTNNCKENQLFVKYISLNSIPTLNPNKNRRRIKFIQIETLTQEKYDILATDKQSSYRGILFYGV